MTERETERLVAWSRELRQVHARLREALRLTRETLDADSTHDLLLYCRGLCTALHGHHTGEDRTLFPAIAARHPHLRPVLRQLEQDHSTIAYLLAALREAVDRQADPGELERHLEGVEAVVENHFRFEERRLLTVLETLDLREDPADVLGPL
ncbi:hemerythrin domain-containing protein [Kineococcus sp. SYSU DK003]|uniref:hemerythrin domain-containing protein n=1 Tax=Kineococcus sp. SYSU DK003 TaxID=3383124 RepID=UPI003D7D82D3